MIFLSMYTDNSDIFIWFSLNFWCQKNWNFLRIFPVDYWPCIRLNLRALNIHPLGLRFDIKNETKWHRLISSVDSKIFFNTWINVLLMKLPLCGFTTAAFPALWEQNWKVGKSACLWLNFPQQLSKMFNL